MSTDTTSVLTESAGQEPSSRSDRENAVLMAVRRVAEAWARHDADAVAAAFIEDGVLILPGDNFNEGRAEIAAFLTAGFTGPFAGTTLTARPVDIRLATDEVALVRTYGGLLPAGETEIAPHQAVRSTWVVVHRDGDWRIAGFHSTPGPGAAAR